MTVGTVGTRLPWAGAGMPLTGVASAREALARAGLDWEVGQEPLFLDGGSPVPGFRAVVRRDTGATLGVVSPSWRPVQNSALADLCDSIARESGAKFEAVGSAKGGRIVWFLMELLEGFSVAGDEMKAFVLASNAHDGSRSARACVTPLRVACANAIRLAERRGSGVVAIRHTATAAARMRTAQRVISCAVDDLATFRERAESLASRSMTDPQVSEFVEAMLPLPDGDGSRHPGILGARESVRGRILGEGIALGGARILATRWSALQGLIEHLDHGRRFKDDERRFCSVMLDGAASLKRRALEFLSKN